MNVRIRKKTMIICLLLIVLSTMRTETRIFGACQGSIELQNFPVTANLLEMTLYKVAEQMEDGSYVLCDDFLEKADVLSDLSDDTRMQEAADALASYAVENNLSGSVLPVDSDGEIRFPELDPALYLVAQTHGSEQIVVQSSLVLIANGDSGHVVISPKYLLSKGAVIVTMTNRSGIPLEGAVFVLQVKTDEEVWTEYDMELFSDENGQFVVTELPQGDYRFVEKEAPAGYLPDQNPVAFTITVGATVEKNEEGKYQEKEPGTAVLLNITKDLDEENSSSEDPGDGEEDPSVTPTESPAESPTESPSENPIEALSENPTESLSENPTESPDETPTEAPSVTPTESPAVSPSAAPSVTSEAEEGSGAVPTITEAAVSEMVPTVTDAVSQSTGVKTGDDTPMVVFVLLLVSAAWTGVFAARKLRG
jgi:hypothetical protein